MKRTVLTLALLAASSSAAATLVCSNVIDGGFITEVQSWQVGQTKPQFSLPIGSVVCSADGPELGYIRARFQGVPITIKGGGPVVWRSDMALFVLDNL